MSPERALVDFNQAIEREKSNSPYQVDDLVDRGRILLRGKKYREALASFTAALALRSDHPQALRLQAEALFHLGRFEEVVAVFDRYLETGKPLESVYRGRGLARAELGRFPGAIEDFTKALELGPTSAVQAYRGWMHLGVDAPKLALRDFELAIELDPRNGDAYSGRGVVHASQARYREATRDAGEALRLGPPSPRLFYNAARIYAQCPDPHPQRALALIQQAMSCAPSRSTTRVLVQEYPKGPGPVRAASPPRLHPTGNLVAAKELTDIRGFPRFPDETNSMHLLFAKADRLSGEVIDAAIEVHRIMGPGLLESIYERCLLRELELRGIPVLNQEEVVIDYKGTVFKEKLKFDLLADGCLLMELKAIQDVLPIHKAQLLSYMKLLNMPLGLVFNFHEIKLVDGISRLILPGANTP